MHKTELTSTPQACMLAGTAHRKTDIGLCASGTLLSKVKALAASEVECAKQRSEAASHARLADKLATQLAAAPKVGM